MRRWLAALAFVPALAWGQSGICHAPQAEDNYLRIAETVVRTANRGADQAGAMRAVRESTPGGLETHMWLQGLAYAYRHQGLADISDTAMAIKAACVEYVRQRRPLR